MGTTHNGLGKGFASDMQCWLLTACEALQCRQDGCYPEIEAVRRAIKEQNREVIAVGLEVACSHLKNELSSFQRDWLQQLAEEVRSGSMTGIRRSVTELSRASQQGQALAA